MSIELNQFPNILGMQVVYIVDILTAHFKQGNEFTRKILSFSQG